MCFQGAVLINGNAARVVERYLSFQEGIAYGIDQLLEPPGLGAHCDGIQNKTTQVSLYMMNALTLSIQMLMLALVLHFFYFRIIC